MQLGFAAIGFIVIGVVVIYGIYAILKSVKIKKLK